METKALTRRQLFGLVAGAIAAPAVGKLAPPLPLKCGDFITVKTPHAVEVQRAWEAFNALIHAWSVQRNYAILSYYDGEREAYYVRAVPQIQPVRTNIGVDFWVGREALPMSTNRFYLGYLDPAGTALEDLREREVSRNAPGRGDT